MISRVSLAYGTYYLGGGGEIFFKPPGTSSGPQSVKALKLPWFWNSGPLPCDRSSFTTLLLRPVVAKLLKPVFLNDGVSTGRFNWNEILCCRVQVEIKQDAVMVYVTTYSISHFLTRALQNRDREEIDCCVFSFGWFPGVWNLYADVSEHSVSSS